MSRLHLFSLPVCAVMAVAVTACSGSPVSPSETLGAQPGAASSQARPGLPVGSYELRFMDTRLNIITSMAVQTGELVLNAHILDANGQPAQDGTAIFEYCSYRGLPTNDINRADEAPASACQDPSVARWRQIGSFGVSNGDAYLDFGVVRIPRTIGFRLRYMRSSHIAPGTTDPADFVWTAQ